MPSPTGHRLPRKAVFAAALLLWVLSEGQAHAYLDPGSISLFFQTLIAALFGGLLILKHYWADIKSGIRRRFSSKPEDDEG